MPYASFLKMSKWTLIIKVLKIQLYYYIEAKSGPQLEVSARPVQPLERFEQAQVPLRGKKIL